MNKKNLVKILFLFAVAFLMISAPIITFALSKSASVNDDLSKEKTSGEEGGNNIKIYSS